MLSETWQPPMREAHFGGRYAAAVELAIAAGNSTLRHFYHRDFTVESKSDRTPVTAADRNSERIIREAVAHRFAGDAVLGEEFGESPGDSGYKWIIDPIDGTKSFITGVPLYSTLVAVTHNDQPVIGVIYLPALGQIVVAAEGEPAWTNDKDAAVQARVSTTSSLEEAAFVTTQLDSFDRVEGGRAVYDALERRCAITRTWGDGYGYFLLATGRAEIMLDPIVSPWDVAAVAPVITAAGGRITDWDFGDWRRQNRTIATNEALAAQVKSVVQETLGGR